MAVQKIRKERLVRPVRIPIRAITILLVLLSSFLAYPGCGHISGDLGFMQRNRSLENTFHNQPRVELLRELSPQGYFRLEGYLVLSKQQDTLLLAVAVSHRYGQKEVVVARELAVGIPFYDVFIPEGEYNLFFFADLDRNGSFESPGLVGQTAPDHPIRVAADRTEDGFTIESPKVGIDFNHPRVSDFPLHIKVRSRTYIFDSLESDIFDPRYGQIGLYRPTTLITQTQGFLFGLEEYDAHKTQVIFVHGIGSTPRDWKFIIQGIDRTRFQPWFFYYPSGLPPEKLGSLLARILIDIEKALKDPSRRLVIVADSMGGLVGQAAINKPLPRRSPSSLFKDVFPLFDPLRGSRGSKDRG